MCAGCLAFKMGITPRRMLQKTFFNAVKKEFETSYPNLLYLPQAEDNRFVGGKSCNTQRRQPDQGWRVGPLINGLYRFIDGELDENSHRDSSYTPDCEIGKMFDTNFGVNSGQDEVIFIRVGLNYKHKQKEFEKTVSDYVERLTYWIQLKTPCQELYSDKQPLKVGVEYINYDNDDSIAIAKIDENVVVLK